MGVNPGTRPCTWWVGTGGVTFKNKYTYKVNSFFFVLFHVGGVKGTLYGYNTLNDTHVESVKRNKIELYKLDLCRRCRRCTIENQVI